MLLAGVCAAVYSTFSKSLILIYGPILFTAMSITIGMLLLYPIAYNFDTFSHLPTFSGAGWISLIFLGIIGGAFQFAAYTWALVWLTPTRTAIYLTLTPICAIILAFALLDEKITSEVLIGLGFVLTAIFTLNHARTKI